MPVSLGTLSAPSGSLEYRVVPCFRGGVGTAATGVLATAIGLQVLRVSSGPSAGFSAQIVFPCVATALGITSATLRVKPSSTGAWEGAAEAPSSANGYKGLFNVSTATATCDLEVVIATAMGYSLSRQISSIIVDSQMVPVFAPWLSYEYRAPNAVYASSSYTFASGAAGFQSADSLLTRGGGGGGGITVVRSGTQLNPEQTATDGEVAAGQSGSAAGGAGAGFGAGGGGAGGLGSGAGATGPRGGRGADGFAYIRTSAGEEFFLRDSGTVRLDLAASSVSIFLVGGGGGGGSGLYGAPGGGGGAGSLEMATLGEVSAGAHYAVIVGLGGDPGHPGTSTTVKGVTSAQGGPAGMHGLANGTVGGGGYGSSRGGSGAYPGQTMEFPGAGGSNMVLSTTPFSSWIASANASFSLTNGPTALYVLAALGPKFTFCPGRPGARKSLAGGTVAGGGAGGMVVSQKGSKWWWIGGTEGGGSVGAAGGTGYGAGGGGASAGATAGSGTDGFAYMRTSSGEEFFAAMSTTFTLTKAAGFAAFMLIGGGGGGGGNGLQPGGGGGAGSLKWYVTPDYSLAAGRQYAVTIGSGGGPNQSGTATRVQVGDSTYISAAGGAPGGTSTSSGTYAVGGAGSSKGGQAAGPDGADISSEYPPAGSAGSGGVGQDAVLMWMIQQRNSELDPTNCHLSWTSSDGRSGSSTGTTPLSLEASASYESKIGAEGHAVVTVTPYGWLANWDAQTVVLSSKKPELSITSSDTTTAYLKAFSPAIPGLSVADAPAVVTRLNESSGGWEAQAVSPSFDAGFQLVYPLPRGYRYRFTFQATNGLRPSAEIQVP